MWVGFAANYAISNELVELCDVFSGRFFILTASVFRLSVMLVF